MRMEHRSPTSPSPLGTMTRRETDSLSLSQQQAGASRTNTPTPFGAHKFCFSICFGFAVVAVCFNAVRIVLSARVKASHVASVRWERRF